MPQQSPQVFILTMASGINLSYVDAVMEMAPTASQKDAATIRVLPDKQHKAFRGSTSNHA